MSVGNRHELVIELVEQVPGLLADLIEKGTGHPVPEHDTITSSAESANLRRPVELRADAVRVFRQDGSPRLAAVVEMQHREVEKKRFDWPHFLFATRVEHQCPTVLLVVTVSAKTAAWAREPIDGGYGQSLVRPIVVCLEELDPGADLGTSLMFAFADSATAEDLRQIANELAEIPADQAKQYAEILLTGLEGTAYETWRSIMLDDKRFYQHSYAQELLSKGRAEGLSEGRAEGEAKAILTVLAARGIEVPERVKRKILACKDQAQLEHWLREAVTTDDVNRLFSE